MIQGIHDLPIEQYLQSLMTGRENKDVEFKSARGGFPKTFWESYSSMANTDGGIIIFGVKENDDHSFSAQPLTAGQVEVYKTSFFNGQNNRQIVSVPLLTDKDIQDYTYGGGHILIFEIPRATREQRPIYVGPDPMTGTFRRNNEGDYRCDATVPTQMFAERSSTIGTIESRILKGFSWDDIDMASFRQYRTIFANLQPSHPWTALDDIELMRKLGGYRQDRISGEKGFTLAGLLMFGKYDSITDPSCAPGFMVDYRDIPSDTSVMRWSDRLYPDGTWEANLFQFYRLLLPKLSASLPKPFLLQGDTRVDDTSAFIALREAVINTLVHASYGGPKTITVTKSPKGILLSNPGTMLVSLTQFYEGGISECRNPSLQKMFSLIGRSDKAGSGADKILKGWREANRRSPYIEEKSKPDMVELFLPLESLFSAESLAKLTNIFGKKIEKISHDALSVLVFAIENESITNADLRQIIELHPTDITKLLHNLCQEGFITSTGIGRGTVYKINGVVHRNHIVTSSDVTSSDVTSSDVTSSDVTSSDVTSPTPITDEEIQAIKAYCSTWRRISEISKHISRNTAHTRNRIIKNLVRNRLLEMEYPDKPTHPNQRYRWKD